jgi:hypothetical protein
LVPLHAEFRLNLGASDAIVPHSLQPGWDLQTTTQQTPPEFGWQGIVSPVRTYARKIAESAGAVTDVQGLIDFSYIFWIRLTCWEGEFQGIE